MAQDAPDANWPTLLQDINACASNALEALAAGDLATVRTNISAICDAVREEIEAIEEQEPPKSAEI